MILFLDSSSGLCRIWLEDNGRTKYFERELGRDMARDILAFIKESLNDFGSEWTKISQVAIFSGPGSFTGLRIGATVANSIADSLSIPIVGVSENSHSGQDSGWIDEARIRLQAGEDDKIVVPFYGAEANITKPRK